MFCTTITDYSSFIMSISNCLEHTLQEIWSKDNNTQLGKHASFELTKCEMHFQSCLGKLKLVYI